MGDGFMSHPRKNMPLMKPDTLFKIARREVWRPFAQRGVRRQGNARYGKVRLIKHKGHDIEGNVVKDK